jgi:SAM-dependent methyltransferase
MPAEKPLSVRARRSASHALAVASDLTNRAANRVATGGATLAGDRTVEYGFVLARIPEGEGELLDFGSGTGNLALTAAERGWRVTAFDRMAIELAYRHPRVRQLQGDVLTHDFGSDRFELILNCSSIEHVGLPGRYGSFDEQDGDIRAMRVLHGLLAGGGRMLLTIPVGTDGVFAPRHRVYGAERLPRLLDGFEAVEERYWQKDGDQWAETDQRTALGVQGSEAFYALGLFALEPR